MIGRDEFWSSGDIKLPGYDGKDVGSSVANASIILRTLQSQDNYDNTPTAAAAAPMMKNLRVKICGGMSYVGVLF